VALAIGADGTTLEHFGYAERFAVYEFGPGTPVQREIREAAAFCRREDKEANLQAVAGLLCDCRAVICAAIGPCARLELSFSNVEAYEFDGSVEAAIQVIARRPLFGRPPQRTESVRESSE
jgi:predicted Fe-Mo cluster-binding NifX family protein